MPYVELTLTELLIAALAVWEIVEIWRHSLLFADWRSRTEVRVDRFGELMQCNFCLSPWVAAVAVVALLAVDIQSHHSRDTLLYWVIEIVWWVWTILRIGIYAFAVARLANLGNDLFYDYCRTPKHNKLLPFVEDVDADDDISNSNLNSESDDDSGQEPGEPGEPEAGTPDIRSGDRGEAA